MELKNKHDNDPHWELKRIELRLHFLRGELGAADRLDGWTLEGHKEEMRGLLNEYHNIIDKELKDDITIKDNTICIDFEKYCLDNGIDPYLQTR